MQSFTLLACKNLLRNKLRTALTLAAVAVLVCIFSLVTTVTQTVTRLIEGHASQTRLIIRERYLAPSRVPLRYVREIAALHDVGDSTVWHYFTGVLPGSDQRAVGFATQMDNLREMHPGLEQLDDAVLGQMNREQNGVLVGRSLMRRLRLRPGQRFTLQSPERGLALEFRVIAVLPGENWSHNFFFREDYLTRNLDNCNTVNAIWLKVADEALARDLAATIETMYEHAPTQVRVETEAAGSDKLARSSKGICRLLSLINAILVADMLLIVANSIRLTVQERAPEVALLKILGFPRIALVFLIVAEAVSTAAAGGFVGSLTAFGLSRLSSAGFLWLQHPLLAHFRVRPTVLWQGAAIAVLVAFVASAWPAVSLNRVTLQDAHTI